MNIRPASLNGQERLIDDYFSLPGHAPKENKQAIRIASPTSSPLALPSYLTDSPRRLSLDEEKAQPALEAVPEEPSIGNQLKAHALNASAMFTGTLFWMFVYYTSPLFEKLELGGYFLHSLLMGIVANWVAMPFVRMESLLEGSSAEAATSDMYHYFWLCLLPDALYEPLADTFIAMCNANSFTQFEFEVYADPQYSPREIAASIALFGGAFGLLYAGLKKVLHIEAQAFEENSYEKNSTHKLMRALKKSREIIESSTADSVKNALQYVVFYLTDYFWEVDYHGDLVKTALNLAGCCGSMAAYTFIMDSLPEIILGLEKCVNRCSSPTILEIPDADVVELTSPFDDLEIKHENVTASSNLSSPLLGSLFGERGSTFFSSRVSSSPSPVMSESLRF